MSDRKENWDQTTHVKTPFKGGEVKGFAVEERHESKSGKSSTSRKQGIIEELFSSKSRKWSKPVLCSFYFWGLCFLLLLICGLDSMSRKSQNVDEASISPLSTVSPESDSNSKTDALPGSPTQNKDEEKKIWDVYANMNCYSGHGASDHACCPKDDWTYRSYESCQKHCIETEGCNGITFQSNSCYLRHKVEPSRCNNVKGWTSAQYLTLPLRLAWSQV